MPKITVAEIEVLCKLLIDKLKGDNLTEIEVSTDEYWIVLTDNWENFKKQPELAVGSLKDDIKYLKQAIDEGQMYAYSHLDNLASVLRAISEKQNPSTITLFADFNNTDEKRRLRLNCNGTIEDLERLNVKLREGLEIVLDSGEELYSNGIVRFSKEENIWVAEINWDKIGRRKDY